MRDVIRNYARLEKKIRSKTASIVKRAVFGSFAQDNVLTAQSSTFKDEVRDNVEIFEQFGFTSQPPQGSEGLVLAVNGDSSHPIGLAVGDRSSRVSTLSSGETCVYSQNGSTIILSENGDITITPGPGSHVKLGGDAAALAVSRETDPVYIPSLQALQAILSAWTPVPNDGGAALKTALAVAWLSADPNDGYISGGGEGSQST